MQSNSTDLVAVTEDLYEPAQVTEQSTELVETEAPEVPETLMALYAVVDRLDGVLEDENTRLLAFDSIDLEESAYRKAKAMLELERAESFARATQLPEEAEEKLNQLRERIDLNMRLLSTQLEAVKGITDRLTVTMKDLDSDGTYQAPYGNW
ncbi:hypothetical protein [Polycladidibacter stylochi]|uniref:hypothetical protein n=1 Tax=Polycladidibacter stylochi TaxID=1807766 RepID=UPI0008324CA1|nr:hypothetical protein [Pseudovibrio stylochi]